MTCKGAKACTSTAANSYRDTSALKSRARHLVVPLILVVLAFDLSPASSILFACLCKKGAACECAENGSCCATMQAQGSHHRGSHTFCQGHRTNSADKGKATPLPFLREGLLPGPARIHFITSSYFLQESRSFTLDYLPVLADPPPRPFISFA